MPTIETGNKNPVRLSGKRKKKKHTHTQEETKTEKNHLLRDK